jgi:hypothetical protein
LARTDQYSSTSCIFYAGFPSQIQGAKNTMAPKTGLNIALGTKTKTDLRINRFRNCFLRAQAVTAFVDARAQQPHVARGAPSDTDSRLLRDYFDGQEQRRLHPWREAQQRHMAERDSILSAGRDQLLAVFADMAKQQLLSPEDAWFLHVLFSGDQSTRLYAAGLILRHPTPQARFERFNLAGFADQGFLTANGDAVLRLQVPLLPPEAAFAAINTRLTSEARAVSGGGETAPVGAKAFRAAPLSAGD